MNGLKLRFDLSMFGALLSKILILVAFAFVCVGTVKATETEDFLLGTTFGMSQPEVRKALRKHHARLLEYLEYEKNTAKPLITVHGDYFVTEKGGIYQMFMPSVEMFGATVEAEFRFEAERLSLVTLYFRSDGNPKAFAAKIERSLREHYKPTGPGWPSEQAEADDAMRRFWPHAYRLNFTSKSTKASFWVNIVDRPEPELHLWFCPKNGDVSGAP